MFVAVVYTQGPVYFSYLHLAVSFAISRWKYVLSFGRGGNLAPMTLGLCKVICRKSMKR
jgi:hypothetical protein